MNKEIDVIYQEITKYEQELKKIRSNLNKCTNKTLNILKV